MWEGCYECLLLFYSCPNPARPQLKINIKFLLLIATFHTYSTATKKFVIKEVAIPGYLFTHSKMSAL